MFNTNFSVVPNMAQSQNSFVTFSSDHLKVHLSSDL